MLKLEAVNEENIWDILNLDVFAEQQEFVASNAVSLSEAYLVLKDRTDAQVFPFGIYDSDFGFYQTGELDHDELIAVLDLEN